MRGVILALPRVCLVGRIGFLAKRSLRSFKSRQSWGWALVVVVSKLRSAKRMVIARENSAAGFACDCAAASVQETIRLHTDV